MRIAVINWSRRKAGGVETYLGGVIPELLRAGHKVAFWYEVDLPSNREQIVLPARIRTWSVAELGTTRALSALAEWQPDLIYAHGLLDPQLEAATLKIAPAVFFAHSYYGTCISGAKTFKYPVVRPCQRQFGWECLAHYYPNRCGGLNPLTMVKEYRRQSLRLELMRDYKAIVTHSRYIQAELIKHGLSASSAYRFPYYVHGTHAASEPDESVISLRPILARALPIVGDERQVRAEPSSDGWRLLFMGRMDMLKGGGVLLEALPHAAERLGVPLHVTFAGDGPARRAWERRASRLQRNNNSLHIKFTGWLNGAQIDNLLDECDLLVLPSLWPEPFGLVGPEAGLRGVPIAAFGVGGIPDWLIDGVNGHIASGNPPTAAGLADAIIKCLCDPATHARMKHAAVSLAQKYNMRNHLAALLDVFAGVIGKEELRHREEAEDAHPAHIIY
ncbi:MAG: glycosyltransferase family 4 protein [Pyrinomonadaceae bacterium]